MKPQEIIVENKYRPQALFSVKDDYADELARYLLTHAQPWLKSSSNGKNVRVIYAPRVELAGPAPKPNLEHNREFIDALMKSKNSRATHSNSYATRKPGHYYSSGTYYHNILIPLGSFTFSAINMIVYSEPAAYKNFGAITSKLVENPKILGDILLAIGYTKTHPSREKVMKNPKLYKQLLHSRLYLHALNRMARKKSNHEFIKQQSHLVSDSLIPLVNQQPPSLFPKNTNTVLIRTDDAIVVDHSFYMSSVLPKLTGKKNEVA
jgi:hypothetical protein